VFRQFQHAHLSTQITEWKQQLLARAADVFGGVAPTADTPDLKTLHAKIGQLALENDFLEGALIKAGWFSAPPPDEPVRLPLFSKQLLGHRLLPASASNFFGRVFSCSRAFSRLASGTVMPPTLLRQR